MTSALPVLTTEYRNMAGVADDGELNIDSIITRLLAAGKDDQNTTVNEVLTNVEVTQLCKKAKDLFLTEPSLFELDSPINVIGLYVRSTAKVIYGREKLRKKEKPGDIRGRYRILLEIFELGGHPSENKYLFLGSYVNSGKRSLEVISLLLAYKIKYPKQIYLLRGNHESRAISRLYGFYDDCKRFYNIKLWKAFCSCFNCLPIAAVINGKIFAVHAGISPDLNTLCQIRHIERPTDIPDSGLLCDLMWADPDDSFRGWTDSCRGVSYNFGSDKTEECLKMLGMELIIRSNQLTDNGYEYLANKTLLTINSRYNVYGDDGNKGGFAVIGSDGAVSIQILEETKQV